MNAILATSYPLPTVLNQSSQSPQGRRHRVGGFNLSDTGIDRFNGLLDRIGHSRQPLDGDRLATAARELCSGNQSIAPCIGQRMRRVAAAAMMVADRQWEPANDAVDLARQVVDYVRGQDDLIPDQLPRIGRLDDAIVVEAAWPQLADEVINYFDYRRLYRIEADMRGAPVRQFTFNRRDWEEARLAEIALFKHQRHVGESGYLPGNNRLFLVH